MSHCHATASRQDWRPTNNLHRQPSPATNRKNRGSQQNNKLGRTSWPSCTCAHRCRVLDCYGQPEHQRRSSPNTSDCRHGPHKRHHTLKLSVNHGPAQPCMPRVLEARSRQRAHCQQTPIDPTYVEELEDNHVGYSGQTIKMIVQHLRTEWCIVTTLKKKEAAQAFHVQWDFTSHITKFACELDKQEKLCRDISVPAAEATKIQHYVESMYASMGDQADRRQNLGGGKNPFRHHLQEQGEVQRQT
eukprot:CCRYP_002119-RA/>CCRYP_002119-RA protein AED:0.57 eAED:0.69 QI:0/0/0/1/0/0/2/0/244